MKRMHLHIAVEDLKVSIAFYNQLFGAPPSVEKPDYAKWMLQDPLVNFAISQRGTKFGLDHIGIQVETGEELAEIKARLENAELSLLSQTATTCCYAKSDKHWVQDPTGIAWESYRTLESAITFNDEPATEVASVCCAPTPQFSEQAVQIVARKKSN